MLEGDSPSLANRTIRSSISSGAYLTQLDVFRVMGRVDPDLPLLREYSLATPDRHCPRRRASIYINSSDCSLDCKPPVPFDICNRDVVASQHYSQFSVVCGHDDTMSLSIGEDRLVRRQTSGWDDGCVLE